MKTRLVFLLLGLVALTLFGLLWAFVISPVAPSGNLAWYLFSYAMGLTMIVLPCTLPLAFVIVPLAMGKGPVRGLGMAVSFGLGVALTLSLYGVLAAVIGRTAIGSLGAPLEAVKNWVYFIAGGLAYLFALGEIGLIRFRLPTYTGAAPAFIQKQSDYLKTFFLGLFLGNIGVGCPHPATPLILTEIASSGDILYGWTLFLVHAVGRVIPLIILVLLGILGVNALSWVVAHREKVERLAGWAMVFVAGFILVLGLFSHDWWVYSGQHTFLEAVTGEEYFLGAMIKKLGLAGLPHGHGLPAGQGLFGLPLWLGNWTLVTLWLLPLWWYYKRKKKALMTLPEDEKKTETKIMPWRFWFLLTLSAFLVVTFAYTLPLRFYRQATAEDGHGTMEQMMEVGEMEQMMEEHGTMEAGGDMMMGEEHGSVIFHEENEVTTGLAVNLSVAPPVPETGTSTSLSFFINQKPESAPVPIATLELEHEKLMHVIGARNDLNQFFHIHPEATAAPGVLAVEHIFAAPGVYKIWSEIKQNGVIHAFGHPEFEVAGPGAAFEKEINLGRNVIVGDYQAALAAPAPLSAGTPLVLSLDVHTLTGAAAALDDYLGAAMHLAVISEDLKHFIHTHPQSAAGVDHHSWLPPALAHGGAEEGVVEDGAGAAQFAISFPEPGFYRLFAQFRPAAANLPPDQALLASFWVQVTDRAEVIAPVPEETLPLRLNLSWGTKLFLALALIVLLSLAVKKFL